MQLTPEQDKKLLELAAHLDKMERKLALLIGEKPDPNDPNQRHIPGTNPNQPTK